MTNKQKILMSLLAVAAVTGWYGKWANYGTGYDHGFGDGSRAAQTQAFDNGKKFGLDEGRRMAQTEAEGAAQSKLNVLEAQMRSQYAAQVQTEIQHAYQAGQAAYAKALIDRGFKLAPSSGISPH